MLFPLGMHKSNSSIIRSLILCVNGDSVMKTKICIRKLNGINFDINDSINNEREAISLVHEITRLGFMPSDTLIENLKHVEVSEIIRLYKDIIPELKKVKGVRRGWKPMYPNFPKQVKDASIINLYVNAVRHYVSMGEWLPHYPENDRAVFKEPGNFQKLDYVTEDQYLSVFSDILSSNDSISDFDKSALVWFLDNEPVMAPETIPYKENACIVAAYSLERKKNDLHLYVKTATDVLRLATFISGGDISLSQNTKFNIPKKYHRQLMTVIEEVISEEDIKRHEGKWNKLFHCLHVGKYNWASKTNTIAKKNRNNINLSSTRGQVETHIQNNEIQAAVSVLKNRPGDFARKLDKLLRDSSEDEQEGIVEQFISVADTVSTRVLMQVLGNIKTRLSGKHDETVVFPKGNLQRAVTLKRTVPDINKTVLNSLYEKICGVLRERFSKMDPFENVFIDDSLKRVPLPSQQRSASTALRMLSRGAHVPMGDNKNTIRMFCYWVGQDIDLSAAFLDGSFRNKYSISYRSLRNEYIKAYHSGDIIQAPHGACEFIDIDITNALKSGIRYIALNLFVFSGPSFKEHETCFVGWMTRDEPNDGEIFEPKSVINKVDMTFDGKACIPAIFDIKTREIIWVDMPVGTSSKRLNNVETHMSTIEELSESLVNLTDTKITLHDLFTLHVEGRGGNIVSSPEDADFVFGIEEGDVTIYDITTINGEYLK